MLPDFASRLPGRSAVVLWGEAPPPDELRSLVEQFAEVQGLQAVESNDEAVLAFCSPADVEIGWATLSDSPVFVDAATRVQADGAHVLYLDLQQLLEVALRREGGPRAMRERLVRGLALRGLQSAIAAVTPGDDGLSTRGVVVTSGGDDGLPGLLTSDIEGLTHPPASDAEASFQLEAFYDPRVAERLVTSVTAIQDRSLLTGLLAGPARALDEIVRQLGGRSSIAVYPGGAMRAASRTHSPDELQAAVQRLLLASPAPNALIRIENGWAQVRVGEPPEWNPPTSEASEVGPFVWARGETGGMKFTLDLRKRGRDAVDFELELRRQM